jgi:hypothetical protein
VVVVIVLLLFDVPNCDIEVFLAQRCCQFRHGRGSGMGLVVDGSRLTMTLLTAE